MGLARMALLWLRLVLLAALGCLAAPSQAKAAITDPLTTGTEVVKEASPDEFIIVLGRRRGSARGNPLPLETVDEQQLKSAQGLSIDEVVSKLTQIGQTNPLILVNGRPADTAMSVGALPSEAIARIEILPPATSAVYGEPVAGRVINIVLKSKFQTFQVNPMANLREGAAEPDLGLLLQHTNLAGENQTVLTLNLQRNAPQFEYQAGRPGYTSSVRPEVLDLSTNAQLQRAIGEGSLWSTQGGFGIGTTKVSGGANDQSSIDRTSWNFGSVLSGRLEHHFYALGLSFDGNADVQHLNRLKSKNDALNARLNLSVNGALITLGQSSIQGLLKADYRWSSRHTSQFELGEGVHSALSDDQMDVRIGLAMPWSNGRGATSGALATSINLESMHTGGDWGQKFAASFGWTPFVGFTIDADLSAENSRPSRSLQSKPLSANELVFDRNEGTYTRVNVLRDDFVNTSLVNLSQADLRFSYEIQAKIPINLGINLGRSKDSGRYDRPSTHSESLELTQPSRYVRDATGALTNLDLRTRKLAAQTRDTLSFRVGAVYAFDESPQNGTSPKSTNSAADALAANNTVIDMSFESQLTSIGGLESEQDQGLGEASSKMILRAAISSGRSSVTVTLDRERGRFLREYDGTEVQAPASIYGTLEVSVPLRSLMGAPAPMNGPQLRASLNNLNVQGRTARRLSVSNRRLLDRQRPFNAMLTLTLRL